MSRVSSTLRKEAGPLARRLLTFANSDKGFCYEQLSHSPNAND